MLTIYRGTKSFFGRGPVALTVAACMAAVLLTVLQSQPGAAQEKEPSAVTEPKGPSRAEIKEKQFDVSLEARDIERVLGKLKRASELSKQRITEAALVAESATGALDRGDSKAARTDAQQAAAMFKEIAKQLAALLAEETPQRVAAAQNLAQQLSQAERQFMQQFPGMLNAQANNGKGKIDPRSQVRPKQDPDQKKSGGEGQGKSQKGKSGDPQKKSGEGDDKKKDEKGSGKSDVNKDMPPDGSGKSGDMPPGDDQKGKDGKKGDDGKKDKDGQGARKGDSKDEPKEGDGTGTKKKDQTQGGKGGNADKKEDKDKDAKGGEGGDKKDEKDKDAKGGGGGDKKDEKDKDAKGGGGGDKKDEKEKDAKGGGGGDKKDEKDKDAKGGGGGDKKDENEVDAGGGGGALTEEQRRESLARRAEELAESGKTLDDILKSITQSTDPADAEAVRMIEAVLKETNLQQAIENMQQAAGTIRSGKFDDARLASMDIADRMEIASQRLGNAYRLIVAPQAEELRDIEKALAGLREKLETLETPSQVAAWHREMRELLDKLDKLGISEELRNQLLEEIKKAGFDQTLGNKDLSWNIVSGHYVAPGAYTRALVSLQEEIQARLQNLLLGDLDASPDEATPPKYLELVERYYQVLSRDGGNGRPRDSKATKKK